MEESYPCESSPEALELDAAIELAMQKGNRLMELLETVLREDIPKEKKWLQTVQKYNKGWRWKMCPPYDLSKTVDMLRQKMPGLEGALEFLVVSFANVMALRDIKVDPETMFDDMSECHFGGASFLISTNQCADTAVFSKFFFLDKCIAFLQAVSLYFDQLNRDAINEGIAGVSYGC